MNRLISIKETQLIININILQKKKALGSTIYERNSINPLQSPSENNVEGLFLNLFYEISTALIP